MNPFRHGGRWSSLESVRLGGFLSFPPDAQEVVLEPLNVLIGPNGSGKSNFIEAFELLAATPADFAAAVRDGGGAAEWLWKGAEGARQARIEVELARFGPPIRYGLEFGSANGRVEVLDEVVQETEALSDDEDPFYHYRYNRGHPAISVREESGDFKLRRLQKESLPVDQSVLSRFKNADLYPWVAGVAEFFDAIQMFREWTFGRYAPLRQAQRTDLPSHRLSPDNRNLALVLNHIEHEDGTGFNEALERFLPQFDRMSTYVRGGVIELFVHESGLASPIPAVRLSDGTIRFMAILATLFHPSPPPLVCIEEPELGLHPDAVLDLGRMLIDASERMQLIVTTHSEALVSAMNNAVSSVVVCERPGNGTGLRRLDPDALASWLDDYRLDDLWTRGVLGGNP